MRRVILRLVPFLMICYFFALLDRVNVGFAALQMNKDLGLTPAMFGFAASLFFVSYFLVEVPSNLALQKFGARRWIARIMITWGLVTACMAFVVGPYSLYAMRFILGAAEAGFFPGAILYLTYWLPSQYRARILATFTVSIPLATFLGSPLSVGLLQLDGALGLRGWQWLFMLEGLPTVLLGVACLFVLTDKPAQASWLTRGAAGMADRAHGGGGRRAQAGRASLALAARHEQILPCHGPGLLRRLGHGQRALGLAAAAAEVVRPVQPADRLRQRDPLRHRDRAHGAVGTSLGQDTRAPLAHGHSAPARGRRLHGAGPDRNRGRADDHHGDVLPGGRLCLQGAVLGAFGKLAVGEHARGGPRRDQRDLQPDRRRSDGERGRRGQAADGQLRARDAAARAALRRGRDLRPCARPQRRARNGRGGGEAMSARSKVSKHAITRRGGSRRHAGLRARARGLPGLEQAVPNSTGSAPPRLNAPADACDCHHHIYDGRFPVSPHWRQGFPPGATVADYRLLQRRLGTTRSVVVQPSTYGVDNRCLVDALGQLGSGVARRGRRGHRGQGCGAAGADAMPASAPSGSISFLRRPGERRPRRSWPRSQGG